MQGDLIETGSEVRLRTAFLELGWSRENGALVVLARPGGLNVLGHGPLQTGLDLALGHVTGWTAARSFPRFLWHTLAERDDVLEMMIAIGLGPLKVREYYTLRGDLVKRSVQIENVGLDAVRIYGLRFWLPNVRVGNPQQCRVEAPGNSVRPRVPLDLASTQRRDVLPRRVFAPGLRGGGAFEPAPTQGIGLLAMHGGLPDQTLLCWYDSMTDAAVPFVEGTPGWVDAVSFAHEVGVVGALEANERLEVGAQYLLLLDEAWPKARERFAQVTRPDMYGPQVDRFERTAIYTTSAVLHGGLAVLAHEMDRLADLGIGTLVLRPIHTDDSQADAFSDLATLAPAQGTDADLRYLVARAHERAVKVILDLPLQGCTPLSRYVHEHPDWFVRDEMGRLAWSEPEEVPAVSRHPGAVAYPGGYYLDWHNSELQALLLDHVCHLAETFQLDGFRALGPYSPFANWKRSMPGHASDHALIPLTWLSDVRRTFAERGWAFTLFSTHAGAASSAVCDGVYDYAAHHMFVHTALQRLEAAELGVYLDDLFQTRPWGAARIGFTESHDTALINPLADGLRGSRLSRMMLAGMVICGFIPSLWMGQERHDEAFVRALLKLWQAEPALRYGRALFRDVRCDRSQVMLVIREYAGRRLLGVMHTGAIPITATIELPGRWKRGKLVDRLGLAPFGAPHTEAASIRQLELAPFGVYCFEL
ncbi:alpha-amylase [Candidatus Chloroploca sp. M-50]|uniref:Alpha-amylase n=1 Tax=Candidatus Chloroploca mongolica TaxID=2528176 RepID=A0ABS4DA55_9CHLR|nr:alpha-amylase family glycosyl hydrolase [Candidatus Chloroploca mongolica]MBP1466322.1 alpha-amylase [Candidatus Chloroploca mongolica]